ncbi:MAG: galactokinase [Planctomycetota bacterium]|nr:MAG: galactokinase [Planctomycetota bacterium]
MRSAPQAHDLFQTAFGDLPAILASAPGRIEVLGNHTDYNHGLVLSCAAGARTAAAVSTAADGRVVGVSANLAGGRRTFAVAEAEEPGAPGDWANYLRGLVAALRRRGVEVPGLRIAVATRLPLAAGLSSSAALTTSVLVALDRLLTLGLDRQEMARIGQEAEGRGVGVRCGLLDPLTCLFGTEGHLLLTDFEDLSRATLPMPDGLVFVLADSGVRHDLRVEYNERRLSCEAAARAIAEKRPEVRSLRQVGLADLAALNGAVPERVRRRARHVIAENERVRRAVDCLRAADSSGLGQLLLDSHRSSRADFENSCPELDRLVDFGAADPRCFGARLSGAGFGGVTIHLVEAGLASAYAADLGDRIEAAAGRRPWTAVCRPGAGARLEDLAAGLERDPDQQDETAS